MSNLHNNDPSLMGLHQIQQQQYQIQQQPQQQQQQLETEESKFKRYFHNRAQAQSEKVEEFLTELDRLARGAKLDQEMPHSALEALVREKFVLGLKDRQVQDVVMAHITAQQEKPEHLRDYSLSRLLEIAKSYENDEEEDDEDELDEDYEEGEIGYTPEEKLAYQQALQQQQQHLQQQDKLVEVKKEIPHGLVEEKGYRQQYFMSNSKFVFADKSAKLKGERVELTCDQCSFRCLTKALMASHSLTVHGLEGRTLASSYSRCGQCSAIFLSKVGLKTHLVMMHKKAKKDVFRHELNSDGDEDREDNSLDYYGQNENTVEDVEDYNDVFEYEDKKLTPLSCEVCQYRTTTLAQLRKHMALFHQDLDALHQCKECLYRAVTEDALVRHIAKNHTKPIAQKFRCELCDFVTTKKTELSKHLQKSHRGSKVYICETCGKKFQTDKTLEVHYKVVHLNNKPFACTLCDYKAGQKASLIAHNHSVHEKSKPYVCEHCGYKTTSQSTLNAHNRMVHQKSRPHTCDLCGRSFAARAGMENHILLIHEKQMPFTCDRCGKKFKRRPDLNNHIRCIHEGNYFICNLCNNSFQTARNLERHVTTVHEQMKPFTCEVCGQSFARRERLKHHMERNHQGVPIPPIPTSSSGGMESHHSNMASPHMVASPQVAPSPHPQNLVIPSGISHEHLLHGHQGQHHQEEQDHHQDIRHRLLNSHHSQPHPMVLIMQQQQLQQQQQHH